MTARKIHVGADTDRFGNYYAKLEGTDLSGCGESQNTALGDLVRKCANHLGLTLTIDLITAENYREANRRRDSWRNFPQTPQD